MDQTLDTIIFNTNLSVISVRLSITKTFGDFVVELI